MKNVSISQKRNYDSITVLDLIKSMEVKDIIISILFILSVILSVVTIKSLASNAILSNNIETLSVEKEDLKSNYKSLQTKYVNLVNENTLLEEKLNKSKESIIKLTNVIEELDSQNKELISSNKSYKDRILVYEEREELLNKYEYAIFDDENNRTDITYEQLKTAEELCNENGLDTNFILATIMVESSGNEKCVSKTSTARGYGQFLKGTGQFTYEDLMGNGKGTYDHSMALNGNINIEMMVHYFKYLKSNTESIYATINKYRGLESPKYQAAINKYLVKGGTSLTQLNALY